MNDKSKIEWTDATWNPVTGCTKVSDGCKHCYAERVWKRLAGNPHCEYFKRPFTDVKCHPDRLDQPLRWKKPRRIFVNSMSDLFHEDVPIEFIADIFAIMFIANQHTFQVLTKRPENMNALLNYSLFKVMVNAALLKHGHRVISDSGNEWPIKNVWLGVSVENQQTADERIPLLLQTPAAVRWLSIEPILGEVDLRNPLNLMWLVTTPFSARTGQVGNSVSSWRPSYRIGDPNETPIPPDIDWVVLGGESGPKARPMHPDWVRSVRDQCQQAAGVPFFFKQWGAWAPVDLDTARNVTDWMIVDKHGDIDIPDGRTPREDIGEVAMRVVGKKKAGRTLDGQTFDEYPNDYQN